MRNGINISHYLHGSGQIFARTNFIGLGRLFTWNSTNSVTDRNGVYMGPCKFFIYYIKHEEECFIRYPNTEKWVEKTKRSRVFFNQLRSVWISDETFFRVFDIASQSINDS